MIFAQIFVSNPKRGSINLLFFYDQDLSQKLFLFTTYESWSNFSFLVKFIKHFLSKFFHHTSDSQKYQMDTFFQLPYKQNQLVWVTHEGIRKKIFGASPHLWTPHLVNCGYSIGASLYCTTLSSILLGVQQCTLVYIEQFTLQQYRLERRGIYIPMWKNLDPGIQDPFCPTATLNMFIMLVLPQCTVVSIQGTSSLFLRRGLVHEVPWELYSLWRSKQWGNHETLDQHK